jgi:chromosome segregation ATPase
MMTDDLAQMRDRQDNLEGRVTVLEATVKREAGLRAKMDSDLGEIKATQIAHTRSLQALHDTQSDHTRRLTRIEDKVGGLEDRLGNVEDRLGNVEDRLGRVEGEVGSLKQQMGDVRIGVHAILDLLDAHLARKPWWASRTLRLRRSR